LADPQGVSYRLTRVRRYFAAGNASAGEKLLLDVFDDAPGDPTVNAFLHSLFKETNRLDDLASRYRTKLGENPADLAVLSELVELEADRGRPDDAVAAIDAARRALGDHDADALYQLAHRYLTAGRNTASEQALQDALRTDPAHGPAANDLGYAMTERGENLSEAERLIRLATASEPDNAAYLDSLGWVLYKRGRFAEASEELQRALTVSRRPDPVTLDHLGDALYRSGKRSEAVAQWQSAAEGLAKTPACTCRPQRPESAARRPEP
jgi:Tfp pilus assembly protein PilF